MYLRVGVGHCWPHNKQHIIGQTSHNKQHIIGQTSHNKQHIIGQTSHNKQHIIGQTSLIQLFIVVCCLLEYVHGLVQGEISWDKE